jgi:predicted TIM-barrel fold metal-dependent hydrolase
MRSFLPNFERRSHPENNTSMKKLSLASLVIVCLTNACAQTEKMDFENYNPVSTLVVPEHIITRAKYPFIDVHNHQWEMSRNHLTDLVTDMDKMNMAVMVNLSGVGGNTLKQYADNVRASYPKRFIIFTNIDFDGIGNSDWTEKAVKRLEDDVKNGANGLKIFKTLGLSVFDQSGKRVAVDDPRLDAIWKKCGDLKIPVLIHSADPRSFWDPMDARNERWLELETHPGRRRSSKDPSFQQLLNEQHHMFSKHPETTFIAAHFGWMGNDLAGLGKLMDSLPNIVVEFGAVIAELGRQPRAASAFFNKYQDRILFGKDSWAPEEYVTYFRVLETADEYFPYHKKYHAFWRMYGLALPDDILRKVYYKNALRIIPGIDKGMFP